MLGAKWSGWYVTPTQVAHDSILMSEGNIQMVIGVDIAYKVKDGLIADRLLVWEPVQKTGSPPKLIWHMQV